MFRLQTSFRLLICSISVTEYSAICSLTVRFLFRLLRIYNNDIWYPVTKRKRNFSEKLTIENVGYLVKLQTIAWIWTLYILVRVDFYHNTKGRNTLGIFYRTFFSRWRLLFLLLLTHLAIVSFTAKCVQHNRNWRTTIGEAATAKKKTLGVKNVKCVSALSVLPAMLV